MKNTSSSYRLCIIIFFLLFFEPKFISAQSSNFIEWQKCLGGTDSEYPANVVATKDGGFVIGGYTQSSDGDLLGIAHPPCAWVVKLDHFGTIIWSNSIDAETGKFISSIIQTTDGGFIVAGWTNSTYSGVIVNHGGGGDAWVAKLNADGILVWQKCYGGSSKDYAYSIAENTSEGGGYIFAGVTRSNNGDVFGHHATSPVGDSSDIWVVKISSIGDIEWQKCYGGEGNDQAKSIICTRDQGYAMVGFTASRTGDISTHFADSSNESDAWVIKLNSVGNIIWQHTFGGSDNDIATSLTNASDSGIIIVGRSNSSDINIPGFHTIPLQDPIPDDAFIVHISPTGKILWQHCIGGVQNDFPLSITPTTDGGYLFTGGSDSKDGDLQNIPHHGQLNFIEFDVWLVKLGSDGNIEWQKCFGGSERDYGISVVQTKDGEILCMGTTQSNDGDVSGLHGEAKNTLPGDVWVVKLGLSAGITEPPDFDYRSLILKNFLKIYPNPSSSSVRLEMLSWFTAKNVEIYNLLGTKLSCETKLDQNGANINVHSLPNGTYIARISCTTEKANGTFTLPLIVYH